jgi:hypothetical protein
MDELCSSETSVETQQTTRRHIPEEDTLYLSMPLFNDAVINSLQWYDDKWIMNW